MATYDEWIKHVRFRFSELRELDLANDAQGESRAIGASHIYTVSFQQATPLQLRSRQDRYYNADVPSQVLIQEVEGFWKYIAYSPPFYFKRIYSGSAGIGWLTYRSNELIDELNIYKFVGNRLADLVFLWTELDFEASRSVIRNHTKTFDDDTNRDFLINNQVVFTAVFLNAELGPLMDRWQRLTPLEFAGLSFSLPQVPPIPNDDSESTVFVPSTMRYSTNKTHMRTPAPIRLSHPFAIMSSRTALIERWWKSFVDGRLKDVEEKRQRELKKNTSIPSSSMVHLWLMVFTNDFETHAKEYYKENDAFFEQQLKGFWGEFLSEDTHFSSLTTNYQWITQYASKQIEKRTERLVNTILFFEGPQSSIDPIVVTQLEGKHSFPELAAIVAGELNRWLGEQNLGEEKQQDPPSSEADVDPPELEEERPRQGVIIESYNPSLLQRGNARIVEGTVNLAFRGAKAVVSSLFGSSPPPKQSSASVLLLLLAAASVA